MVTMLLRYFRRRNLCVKQPKLRMCLWHEEESISKGSRRAGV